MPPAPLGFHTWVTISLVAGSPLVSGELRKVESPPEFPAVAVCTNTDELAAGTTRTLKDAPTGMADRFSLKMAQRPVLLSYQTPTGARSYTHPQTPPWSQFGVTNRMAPGRLLVAKLLMKVLSPPLFAEVAVQTKWEVTVTFAAAAAALALARGAAAVKAPAAISVSKKAGRRLRGSRAQRARCCVLWSMVVAPFDRGLAGGCR